MAVKDVVHIQPPADEKILLGLSQIGQVIRSENQKQSFEEQLSPTQAQALILISQGVVTPSEIAERLRISRASLSDSLGSLFEKGLAKKKPNPEDSRSSILELTAKGRKRSDLMSKWPTGLLDSVNTMSTLEKGLFLKGLSKMIAGLQDNALISTQRMCATCRFFRPNAHPGTNKPHHCAYVDAAFSDPELRLDCPEQEPAEKKINF